MKLKILKQGTKQAIELGGKSFVDARSEVVLVINNKEEKIIIDTGMRGDNDWIIKALEEENIGAEDIDYVINTHWHPDHTSNNFLFENAEILFAGIVMIFPDGFIAKFCSSDYIEGLEIIRTPGHAAFHVSVLVESEGKKHVIDGGTFDSEDDILNPENKPPACEDYEKLVESRKKILEIADIIIPGHGAPMDVSEVIGRAKNKTLKNDAPLKPSGTSVSETRVPGGNTMFTKRFEEIRKEDIPTVGGKGANLGEMASIGLPVPPGFVVTAQAYQKFIEETKIKEKIEALLKDLDVEDTEKLNSTAEDIQKTILGAKIPEDIKQEILTLYKDIHGFVAVRSSATAEDLPDASFAGQQETFLNIMGEEGLLEAVHKCFASLFTPRAIYYREKNNFPHESVYLAVVVQKMVNADKAGVIFSVNPVTNNKNEIIIEGAYGLGEAVVLGALTPHSYIIDKETRQVKDKSISKQEWGFYRGEKGGTEKKEISHGHLEVLSEEEAKALTKYTNDIEEHYGKPMDIEWAIEAGEVFIVQARPVTTFK